MTATTAPVCTTRRCTNPATHCLPDFYPGEDNRVCADCLKVYNDCLAELREKDPGY